MTDITQFSINVALLRCIMESNKMASNLTKGISLGWSQELEAEVIKNSQAYAAALEKCFELLEKQSP